MDVERRYLELRAEGRTLTGTAIRYGSVAKIMGFEERFEPGAFGDVSGVDAILNRQHDRRLPLARTLGGGLEMRDSAERLEISAELPQTRDADDVLALIEGRVLRGLSVEFVAKREKWDGSLRTIERAKLFGVAVVDKPAYGDSAIALATRCKPVASQEEFSLWL